MEQRESIKKIKIIKKYVICQVVVAAMKKNNSTKGIKSDRGRCIFDNILAWEGLSDDVTLE